jgi:hypothetical protein
MGLQGADELRRVIGLDEESYLRVAGQSHADVRGYILYTAADEVQKTSIYLMRLREYLQGDAVSPLAGQLDRVMITQVLEDSHTRQRRLVELLTTLVLFSTCNEQDYYRHMLLLEELDGLLSANDDRKEFYGVPSKNVEDSIRHQISWINSVAAKLDSSKMWYVVNGLSLTAPEKLHPGRVLSSQRQRIRKALPVMTSGERLQLGLSYGAVYGHISEMIHYAPNRSDVFLPTNDETLGGTLLGLLAFSILSRCYELLGRPDLSIAKKISGSLARSDASRIVGRAGQRTAEVGDFVLAAGDLAEVLAIKESSYGLVSYRVRYLAERPNPEVLEDWFPTFHVQKLYSKAQYREGLDRLVAQGLLSAADARRLKDAADAEVSEALRASMVHTWRLGLRDWVRDRQRRDRPNSG